MKQQHFALVIATGLVCWSAALCRSDDLLGMCGGSGSRAERAFAAMERAGAAWARSQVTWDEIEPRSGEFIFRKFDQRVAAAVGHHLKLMVTIKAISRWGSSHPPQISENGRYYATYPPKELESYTRFIKTLASHCQGKGIAWQIENEVNSKAFWAGTRDDYLALLRTAYAAVREADAAAIVLPAGLSCSWPHTTAIAARLERHHQWLNAILETKAYDAIDVHDYYLPQSNPLWHTWEMSFEQFLDQYRSWLQAKQVSAPLWMSECGVNSAAIGIDSGRYKFTPQQQAADLEAIYAAARKLGIVHAFWLTLKDRDEGPYSFMGLMTTDLQEKPSWKAYRRLADGK